MNRAARYWLRFSAVISIIILGYVAAAACLLRAASVDELGYVEIFYSVAAVGIVALTVWAVLHTATDKL